MDTDDLHDLHDELAGLNEHINELTVELGVTIDARDALEARLRNTQP